MNPRRQRAQDLLRRTHTLMIVDRVRLGLHERRVRRGNDVFVVRHPGFALPPRHLAYDAHSNTDWYWYKESGEEAARRLVQLLARHGAASPRELLDWGCGPARIVRHLPALLPEAHLHGSDYNPETIEWCSTHIPGVAFAVNGLDPPLPYPDDAFDCVYSISVITHLSESVAEAWLAEMARILEPGGLLILWTNGDKVAQALLPKEKKEYDGGRYVTRRGVREGRKFFLAVHPPAWIRDRLAPFFSIEEELPGGLDGGEQDAWVARRRSE